MTVAIPRNDQLKRNDTLCFKFLAARSCRPEPDACARGTCGCRLRRRKTMLATRSKTRHRSGVKRADSSFQTATVAWHRSLFQRITNADWIVADHIAIKLRLEWQSRAKNSAGGAPLVIEERRYNVRQRDNYTIIDQFSRLLPAANPFTLKADRHSFVGVRVHDLIDPEDGGIMRDSEGRFNLPHKPTTRQRQRASYSFHSRRSSCRRRGCDRPRLG